MTTATPAAAIEARLQANWAQTPVIIDENEVFEYPTTTVGGVAVPAAFVALEFPGAVVEQWTIGDPGNNGWREDGAFLLHILVPSGTGAAQARDYADNLAVIFRGQSFGGVTCWETGSPRPTEPPNGNYYRLTIATRYHYEFLG